MSNPWGVGWLPQARSLVLSVGAVLLLGLICQATPALAAGPPSIGYQQAFTTTDGAKPEAQIDPDGLATTCEVEYVTEAGFLASGWGEALFQPCVEPLGFGTGEVTALARIGSLSIDTTYEYRFIARNSAGTVTGEESSFVTFGIETFGLEATDAADGSFTQAGGHPYELTTTIRFKTNHGRSQSIGKGEFAVNEMSSLKDVKVQLPTGLVGDPTVVPTCAQPAVESFNCDADEQIGVMSIEAAQEGETFDDVPLFNVVPPEGVAARFSARFNNFANAWIDASVRSGADYGVNAESLNITSLAPIRSVTVTFWGVPADSSHDALRACPRDGVVYSAGCSSSLPERPFLFMPTSCAGSSTATLAADSYQRPGAFVEASDPFPAVTGCSRLQFSPGIEAEPTSSAADSPSGLHVDLHVPQDEEPEGLATPDLRDATVTLPEGLTVNPSSAAGLEGCTPRQFGLTTAVGETPIHTTAGPAECPDAAKIGTVEVDTPLLDHPLPGAVYLAKPYENPFDSLLAIYLAVYDPVSGVVVKLAGHVEVGEAGRLTTTFAENPQLPFEDFKLDFFGGPRAPLKTGAVCGTYTTTSSLTPWSAPESGPAATPSGSYAISQEPGGGACPGSAAQEPNAPSFEAGTESPLAGAFSPFVLHLRREDGSQQFGSVTVNLPPGLTGRLAGIPYCPEADLKAAESKTGTEEEASASCPSASEVGTVTVGAGAGPEPYYVSGHAYLAGPYKGEPLSLAIVTPAVAGPFDLGTVVVRSALEVNPYTAQITVRSDPIPSELKNIPLDVRSIAVRIGRPGFTLNPTSCETMSVGGTETSTEGNTAQLTNRFQVGECAKLAFKPRLAFRLKGKTGRAGHPALTATLKMPEGGANIARAQVSLPHAFFLDQGNLDNVCTQPEIAASSCPASSVYGHATAWSPLLEAPLEGPVYLGVGYGYKLPALVAELDGQIRVLLKGRVDSDKQHGIRNTFEVVPDAPVSKFVLSLKGGKKYGLIENSERLCAKVQRASARFVGQNGKVDLLHPRIVAACGKPKKKTPKGKGHRR